MPKPVFRGSCSDCWFFHSRGNDYDGECRKSYPKPRLVTFRDDEHDRLFAEWPIVQDSDWCGAFEEVVDSTEAGE